MTAGDPRSIDPAQAESSEEEVAQLEGSSTPEVDEEEADGRDHSSGSSGDGAALRGMTSADGTSVDQVVSDEPDSAHDHH